MRASVLTAATMCVMLTMTPRVVHTRSNASDDDIRVRTVELVSRNDAGDQANNDNDRAAISADGRFVAFTSIANNLVADDTNDASDVFVHDRRTNRTARVSVGPLGVQGDADSGWLSLLGDADISADGRFVAFASLADNFVPGDTPFTPDVFVHDRSTHTTELISRDALGLPAGGSLAPSISADGRFVAFRSFSDRLTPEGNPNFLDHVFVVDRRDHSIELIDVALDGGQADGSAFTVKISADGRVVAFDSAAGNLVPGDGDQAQDVFVRDRRSPRVEGISTRRPTDTFTGTSLLSSISADGRFVGFESTDVTLVPRDRNGFFSDVFVFDRRRDTLELVSRSSDGEQGDNDSVGALVSRDGRFVVFTSRAGNLVRGDTNQQFDVFLRNLEEGKTVRLAFDNPRPDRFAFEVVATDVAPDGDHVALLTRADLAPEQDVGSFVADVYVLDLRRDRDD